jgi:hypothetical protein
MQHTGMERNEDQWRQLLSSAGFAILRIWRAELGTTAIIEADLEGEETSGVTSEIVARPSGPTLSTNESNEAFSHHIATTSLAETAEPSSQSYPVILGS